MRDFLSSLIDRNQKPQTQVRPRLGSLFEPSPLLGAAMSVLPEPVRDDLMQDDRATEAPRQPLVAPPPPAAPRQRPSATVREEPSKLNPSPGDRPSLTSDPVAGHPGARADMPAPGAEIAQDREAVDRWAQRTVRPIPPSEWLGSVAAAPPVPPADAPPNASSEASISAQALAQPLEPVVEPKPMSAPPSTPPSSTMAQQQTGEPPGRIIQERVIQERIVRLAATVTPPASPEARGNTEIQSLTRSQRRESTPIWPARIAPAASDTALPSPAAIVPQPARAGQGRVREASPPTIRVSIGRIEVQANVQEPPQPRPAGRQPARRQPALSLSDYLKQRGGGP